MNPERQISGLGAEEWGVGKNEASFFPQSMFYQQKPQHSEFLQF